MTDEDYIRQYLDDPTVLAMSSPETFSAGDENDDTTYIRQYLDDPIS